MSPEVQQFIYGAVAGGVVALALRIFETYWIRPRLTASREQREKLLLYSRHLYFSCGQAEFRLNHICKQKPGSASLKLSLKNAETFQWYTKDGYYLTSTAYLIALVACWIVILQRDIVFLPFKRKADTREFLNLVEQFKTVLSTRTILWYQYIDGLGEMLIPQGQSPPRPMGPAAFSQKLFTDPMFRDYYDQLVQFLNKVASGSYLEQIDQAAKTLAHMRRFLVVKRAVSEIELGSTDVD